MSEDTEALTMIAALVAGDRWLNADACAVHLGMIVKGKPNRRGFLERIACLPGFPKPRKRAAGPQWDTVAIDRWCDSMRGMHVEMPSCLYRHFDSDDQLLYVGVSLNAIYRLAQHRRNATWFRRIARVTVEWFDNRREALMAERKAIRAEKPMHNHKGAEGVGR